MKKTNVCSWYCTLIYYVLDAPIGSLGKLMRRDSDLNRSKLFNSEICINLCVEKILVKQISQVVRTKKLVDQLHFMFAHEVKYMKYS